MLHPLKAMSSSLSPTNSPTPLQILSRVLASQIAITLVPILAVLLHIFYIEPPCSYLMIPLSKHCAKAMKLKLPPLVAGKSPAKGAQKRAKAPAPTPTLAATREQRAAVDVAYLNRPDGYHIKQVVRQLSPGPAPPVPYLPGEEDILHSDAESDDSNGTALELACPANPNGLPTNPRVPAETKDTPTEPDDLVDYDAEGEAEAEDGDRDGDGDGDGDINMQDLPLANCSFYRDPECAGTPGFTTQTGTAPSTWPADLFANASQDDIQAVFGSLDALRFGTDTDNNHLPSLTNAYPHPARNLFGNGQEYDLPHLRPPSRVTTPAPWIV
ncbi:hypothetical protein FRC06_002249, partial [Ceratobasidium sp. 370]